jgi:chemotaxis protein CheX
LKIEYMNPFVESALQTLERVSGQPVTAGPPNLFGAIYPGASVNVAAKVEGALCGDLICSMSGSTARSLAETVVGGSVQDFGETLRRGLVMLAEEWSGQARLLLADEGMVCEVSEPVVFQGLNVEMATTQPALTAPMETSVGQVNISVAVRDGK